MYLELFAAVQLTVLPLSVRRYAAKWRGYEVAVKMLDDKDVLFVSDQDSSNNKIQSDALFQEIRVFQELQHDNIITFIGACSDGSHFYICTEFASEGSLYNFLHAKRNQYAVQVGCVDCICIAAGLSVLCTDPFRSQ